MQHSHKFSDHPNPDWNLTHVSCIICGMNITRDFPPYALSHGATFYRVLSVDESA
jgi:hypothetical protein